MDWKRIKKIDAHVHLLPPERLALFQQAGDEPWASADPEIYLKLMEQYNVETAVLLPINDGRTYCSRAEDTNRWLGQMQRAYRGRFAGFADVLKEGAYFMEDAPYVLEEGVKEHGLRGLKLHPQNLQLDADSLEYVPLYRKAAELGVPVVVHSNPCRVGFHDNCAPDKISKMLRVFPDVTVITAHMGGMKWQDALTGCGYVDMSGVLPWFVEVYGIRQTNRILRAFGPERLIFGTDYPDVRGVEPGAVYETYCGILNQMDFSEKEAERIAYGNMAALLG